MKLLVTRGIAVQVEWLGCMQTAAGWGVNGKCGMEVEVVSVNSS